MTNWITATALDLTLRAAMALWFAWVIRYTYLEYRRHRHRVNPEFVARMRQLGLL